MRLDGGEYRGLVAAEHGGHAGLLGGRGRGHALGPDPHQAHRVVGADDARQHAGRELADAVPADRYGLAADRVRTRHHLVERCGERGRHQQRLGDGGVPDLVRVSRGPAPDQIASR